MYLVILQNIVLLNTFFCHKRSKYIIVCSNIKKGGKMMINCRCRRFCCMNNCQNYDKNTIERSCEQISNCPVMDYNENCNCGFDEEEDNVFPKNPALGQSYVPIQYMDETFKPCVGLENGTLFPELVSQYKPGDSMREIEYLRNTNPIGEGCNANGR